MKFKFGQQVNIINLPFFEGQVGTAIDHKTVKYEYYGEFGKEEYEATTEVCSYLVFLCGKEYWVSENNLELYHVKPQTPTPGSKLSVVK